MEMPSIYIGISTGFSTIIHRLLTELNAGKSLMVVVEGGRGLSYPGGGGGGGGSIPLSTHL